MATLTAAERRQLINFNMGALFKTSPLRCRTTQRPKCALILEPIRASDGAQLYENSRIPDGGDSCSGGTLIQRNSANTRFSYTWTNTGNWNRLKRGMSYCVKVTAPIPVTPTHRERNLTSIVWCHLILTNTPHPFERPRASTSSWLSNVYGPVFNGELHWYATQRVNVPWNSTTHTANFSGNSVRRNTSYCIKVINGFANRNLLSGPSMRNHGTIPHHSPSFWSPSCRRRR